VTGVTATDAAAWVARAPFWPRRRPQIRSLPVSPTESYSSPPESAVGGTAGPSRGPGRALRLAASAVGLGIARAQAHHDRGLRMALSPQPPGLRACQAAILRPGLGGRSGEHCDAGRVIECQWPL
jgi:hypothetical protein